MIMIDPTNKSGRIQFPFNLLILFALLIMLIMTNLNWAATFISERYTFTNAGQEGRTGLYQAVSVDAHLLLG